MKKNRLLIAISGGMDSVALFHLCLRSKIKNKIFAVHVNHQLRAESKTDQEDES